MTVRVGIQTFAMMLLAEGLDNDATGKGITANYLARIAEINELMAGDAAKEGEAEGVTKP
jgi:hypothetical protein